MYFTGCWLDKCFCLEFILWFIDYFWGILSEYSVDCVLLGPRLRHNHDSSRNFQATDIFIKLRQYLIMHYYVNSQSLFNARLFSVVRFKGQCKVGRKTVSFDSPVEKRQYRHCH